tara:strand:- start:201 stop:431 length:231 start_codon:yes stop_codon:yes gene_type:complete
VGEIRLYFSWKLIPSNKPEIIMNPSQILERLMNRLEKTCADDDNDNFVEELNILQEAILRLETYDSDWMISEFSGE